MLCELMKPGMIWLQASTKNRENERVEDGRTRLRMMSLSS